MPTRTPAWPASPNPTDGPFLLALLIGAKRSGDKDREQHARKQLEEIGIGIRFAKAAPALRGRKAVRRG